MIGILSRAIGAAASAVLVYKLAAWELGDTATEKVAAVCLSFTLAMAGGMFDRGRGR